MVKYQCKLCKRKKVFKKLGIWIIRHYTKLHPKENSWQFERLDNNLKVSEIMNLNK